MQHSNRLSIWTWGCNSLKSLQRRLGGAIMPHNVKLLSEEDGENAIMPFKSETLSCRVMRRSEVVKFMEDGAEGSVADDSGGIEGFGGGFEALIKASAANPRQNAPAVTTPATAPGPCLQSWLWHFPAVFVCDVVVTLLDSDGGMEGGGDVTEFAVGFIRLVVGGGGGEIVPGDLGPTSNEEVKLHHSMLWISVLP
nr:hypothetical protein DVH24_011914 [Ipomoea batatas]